MPPKFSLQAVLDYRHRAVELLEVQYAEALRQLQLARETLQALHGRLQTLFEELRQEQAGTLDLLSIQQTRLNVRATEQAITRQEQVVAEREQAAAESLAKLVKARQDEEALAKLREKELERWRAEQARQENSQRDDVYIARAYRRSAENNGE